MNRKFFLPVIILVLATLACSINIPITQVKTGPSQTTDIHIEPPADPEQVVEILLAFGAGKLTIDPGADNALVDGTATYNVEDFEPKIETRDDYVRIEQGSLDIGGFPSFQGGIENDWELRLGQTPIRLRINAGAYEGEFELGGLALIGLLVTDGASSVDLAFSSPNLIEMEKLSYETGASTVKLEGLANANFTEMVFHSGAGDYTLDFSGALRRDASVTIESGVSSITIIVPEGMDAELSFEGALTDVDMEGEWFLQNGKYQQEGSGPRLTITLKMGAGSVKLRNP